MSIDGAARLVMLGLMALLAGPLAAQAPPPTAERDAQSVRAWLQRWNALGSDNATAIDELLALYAPDALHITGPLPHQRGTATYRGHDGIRVLAWRIAASQQRMTYRIETETANEETAELLHVARWPVATFQKQCSSWACGLYAAAAREPRAFQKVCVCDVNLYSDILILLCERPSR